MAGTTITYNGYSMNSSSVVVNGLRDAQAPERNLSKFNILRTGGGVISDSTYFTKDIVMTGKLMAASMSALETLIDTFHAVFAVSNKNLDIGYAGGTRRYVCTPGAVVIDRDVRGAFWAAFSIVFTTNGYGQATSTTAYKSAVTIIATPSTQTLTTILGSAPEQQLRIAVTVFSATLSTSNIITLKNNTTGELMSVERLWAASDVLEVDCAAHTVKVNGVVVDFTGPFPNFAPGTHDLIVTADFSVFSLRLTVDHYPRYL